MAEGSCLHVDISCCNFTISDCGRTGVLARPYACQSYNPLRRNPKISASTNQNFFQPPNIIDHTKSLSARILGWKAAQIKNRICNQLPWTVKRNITTAITLEDLNSALGQEFRRGHHVRRLGIAPERDHRCMLQQNKRVTDASFFT